MNRNVKCPACGYKDTECYIDKSTPIFLFPVPEELIEVVKPREIQFNICNHCSHIFRVNIDMDVIDLIYTELYEHYNLDTSPQFQEVYHNRFKEFFVKNSLAGLLLDIGCNKAPLFPLFEGMGFRCYGIEPSEVNARIAKENNPESQISNTFFERTEKNVFKEEFDVILMNFVVEHIIDLDLFFDKLKMYTKVGARIFIQVPDVGYCLDNSIDPFCAHEHINYFTYQTLKVLLERRGFKIIDALYGDTPSMIVCAVYTGESKTLLGSDRGAVLFKKYFIRKQEYLAKKVRKILAKEDRLILYGMGIRTVWLSSTCRDVIPADSMLIDDNEFYRGKIKPGFTQKVQPCPQMELNGELILITTTPPYFSKIKELIQRNFTGRYRVGYIENTDMVIEKVNNI